MRKTSLALLIVLLSIPAVVFAEQDDDSPRSSGYRSARDADKLDFEQVRGEIISLAKDSVTIAVGSEDDRQQIEVRVPERRSSLRGLLAQGLGKTAELRFHKNAQGALTLMRIEGIEGLDVSPRSGFGRDVRQGPHDRAGQFGPEQRNEMAGRFGAMAERLRENPELREELRELAQRDPEAFRQRIRQMMPQLHERSVRQGPQQAERGAPMSMAQHMGPQGQQSRRRFSPQDEQALKLERQSHELAQQYRRAEGQTRDELAEKLRDTLSEVFDIKAKAHAQEVENLEKQLDKLRSRLENRQKNREDIINRRFDQLTGQQDDELAW